MRKSKPVYFYIFVGVVVGWVSALLSFIYVGGDQALWALAIFGCLCMFLGCIHFYSKANGIPEKTGVSKEKKSLLDRAKSKVWEE